MGISTGAALLGSSVIGAAGSALGAKGKGGSPSSMTQSGFAALPPEVQKFMLDELLPKTKAYSEQPYQGIPMRGLNAEDLDPVFGSRARVDYTRGQMNDAVQGLAPSEDNVVVMKDGVPTVNQSMYDNNSEYRSAWDAALERHKQQFGMGYRQDSDRDALTRSILNRIGQV